MTYTPPIENLPSTATLASPRLAPVVSALQKHTAAVDALIGAEETRDLLIADQATAVAREHTERQAYAAKVASGAAKVATPFRAPTKHEHAAALADADAVIAAHVQAVGLARIEAEAVIGEHGAAIGEVASDLLAKKIAAARDAVAVAEALVADAQRLQGDTYAGALAQAREVAKDRLGLAPGVGTRLLDSQAARFVAKSLTTDGARRLVMAENRGARLSLGERLDVLSATTFTVADPKAAAPVVYGSDPRGEW